MFDKCFLLLWPELHRLVHHFLHSLPLTGAHGETVLLIWRWSHTLAVAQSRSTVAREMPRTSDISGDERPPKNFISTILACRSSSRDSSSRAWSRHCNSVSPVTGRSPRSSKSIRKPPSRLSALRLRA